MTITVKIKSLAFGGSGIGEVIESPDDASLLGIKAFVPFTIPEEIVICDIIKRHSNYLETQLLSLIQQSPERVSPPCPYFTICGGCSLQHMAYEAQLKYKLAMLKGAMLSAHLPASVCDMVSEITPSPPYHYRNRVSLHKSENGEVGFYKIGSHQVVPIHDCLICEDFNKQKVSAIEHFSQVNTYINSQLVSFVLKNCSQINGNALDLYSGSGNFSIGLAKQGKKTVAVECDKVLVTKGREKAKELGINNLTFELSSTEKYLANHQDKYGVIVADPPRSGLGACAKKLPPSELLIFISCHLPSFIKDLKALLALGYKVEQIQPFDMFAQTTYLEIAVVCRGSV